MQGALPAIGGATPAERLTALRAALSGRIVFTTSFGLEDQALTHLIAMSGLDIEIVTLDTGRLFAATHKLWAETEMRYGRRIRSFHPDASAMQALVADSGANGFYYSKAARVDCCTVRKVEPLRRALAGASAWITGLRADQSAKRGEIGLVEWDETHQLLKASPLHDWTREQVAAFASEENVPINPLHAEGFLSIGCEPCTRAVRPGESERAGRWWWESDDARECGLHLGADGRLTRKEAA